VIGHGNALVVARPCDDHRNPAFRRDGCTCWAAMGDQTHADHHSGSSLHNHEHAEQADTSFQTVVAVEGQKAIRDLSQRENSPAHIQHTDT